MPTKDCEPIFELDLSDRRGEAQVWLCYYNEEWSRTHTEDVNYPYIWWPESHPHPKRFVACALVLLPLDRTIPEEEIQQALKKKDLEKLEGICPA